MADQPVHPDHDNEPDMHWIQDSDSFMPGEREVMIPGGSEGDVLMNPQTRTEIERGLEFAHIMMMVNQNQSQEAIAVLQALVNVLLKKGLVSKAELDEPMAQARKEIDDAPVPRVRLADMGDKYAESENVEIDCHNRVHLCKARCCTFRFFLTKQDLDEGVARWDYGNPYWIKQGADGYCVHSESQTRACTIHPQRPHVCRKYDCRHDSRIWIDFENYIPAPLPPLEKQLPVAMAEVALHEDDKTQLNVDAVDNAQSQAR
jgi:Fe-S-cluster containining protein